MCSSCGTSMARANRYGLCNSCHRNRRCSECGGMIGWKSTSSICNTCARRDRFARMNADGRFRAKISGENHYAWTGDSATYQAAHQRTPKTRGKASRHKCFGLCGKRANQWARIHGTSGTYPINFIPMCYSCHIRYDQTGKVWR